ncbi:MAG: hypothetical protein MK008_09730 [Bdellovibrionales bacterium]|nr:hypothetical protein [Bdellovibrionales bacterium]
MLFLWNPLTQNFQRGSGDFSELKLGKAYLVKAKVLFGREKTSLFGHSRRADYFPTVFRVKSILEIVKEIPIKIKCANKIKCENIYKEKFNLITTKKILSDL